MSEVASSSASSSVSESESVKSHPNTDDEKLFFQAVREGDTKTVLDLLNSEKVRYDARHEDTEETAFHIAATTLGGHRDILEALVKIPGFDVHVTDCRDGTGETAALMCVGLGKLSNLKMLLEVCGSSILSDKGPIGENLLYNAVFSCNDPESCLEIVKFLIDQTGGDLINECDRDGTSVLACAAMNSSTTKELINTLLAAGADVTLADQDGATCLHNAYDNYTVLEALLASGKCAVILDAKDKNGKTVLDLAKEEYNDIVNDEDYTDSDRSNAKRIVDLLSAVII